MNLKFRNHLTLLCLILITHSTRAQDLSVGAHMFSHKKTAYVTKKDGTELEGTIDKVSRKKGLIESVRLKIDGKKVELNPEEIDHMYLPPSGLDKFTKAYDEATTMAKWDREDVESEKIKEGYAYFENAQVLIKKKSQGLLMQLLNPGFSKNLRVFMDPLANETASAGIGPIAVVGGLEKSYYVQRPGQDAYRLKKKEYKKDFENFYKDCPDLLNKYPDPDWPDFAKHVFFYSESCK